MRLALLLPHILLAAAAVELLAAAAVPAEPAAVPDPVIGHAVFNDPAGSTTAQNAIQIQLAGLIDRVPAGEEIQGSFFGFDPPDTADTATDPDIVDRLVAAHARGVKVRLVVDQKSAATPATNRLRAAIGSAENQPSYVVHCADKSPAGTIRGCIATRVKQWSDGPVTPYNHNKFFTFSKIRHSGGAEVGSVVYQASANLGIWDQNEAYNNALTYSDPKTYGAYRTYFSDLLAYRSVPGGNNNYYKDSGSGTDYRVFFFPRQERAGQPFDDPATDTVYNSLGSVHCSYTEPDGSRHQTDVRVAMWDFNRPAIAQRLAQLRKDGCWVDVVLTNANDAVMSALKSAPVQITRCNYNVAPGIDIRVHSKYLIIDGGYDDDIVPRVFTGSHNFSYSALRQADESLVRVMGRTIHTEYLQNFWQIRDTCRAKGGIIT
ncbi:phospholipase D-like domain-containing protein [Kribbella sp. NPDC048915]|uniref:phospholipase D-like domain-containing protein n=1 Tax=Kribbella sp. NPDC048915 TaxID=3155148 RepID=UPI0033BFCE64